MAERTVAAARAVGQRERGAETAAAETGGDRHGYSGRAREHVGGEFLAHATDRPAALRHGEIGREAALVDEGALALLVDLAEERGLLAARAWGLGLFAARVGDWIGAVAKDVVVHRLLLRLTLIFEEHDHDQLADLGLVEA